MLKIFKLNEICCAVCAAKAEKHVEKIKGIYNANIDFMTQRLAVETEEFSEEIIAEITAAVKKIEPDCEVIPL